MVKKFFQYIKEDTDNNIDIDKYTELKKYIKSMIKSTVEKSGESYDNFISSFVRDPESNRIEGLVNDSDIYEFYLKFRNDIDEVLNDINFFDELPNKFNAYGLYEYTIKGTETAVIELIKKF